MDDLDAVTDDLTILDCDFIRVSERDSSDFAQFLQARRKFPSEKKDVQFEETRHTPGATLSPISYT